jgi:hypothetical protein
MNIEFHYYIIHFLANQAGFPEEDARTIAYSSQFVDHNIISYSIKTGTGTYGTVPTQNYGFWDDSFPREVYVPFHFFPGDPDYEGGKRTDGRKNVLNCTPNSPPVKELLISALKTRNLYRVGIALHTYADSWAHQNFSGLLEEWNRIDNRSPVPPIGHAQALRKPDNPGISWRDPRLLGNLKDIVNRDRILAAARMIYKYLCTYNRRGFEDAEVVEWKLSDLIGLPGQKTGDERISDLVIEDGIEKYRRSEWLKAAFHLTEDPGRSDIFAGYDKLLWLKDAVLYRSSIVERTPVVALPNFFESDFYKWHESARDHLAAAKTILKAVGY